MVRWHDWPEPAQAPVHPLNCETLRPNGSGDSRTVMPIGNRNVHRDVLHTWSEPAPSFSVTWMLPPPPPDFGSCTRTVNCQSVCVNVPVTVAPDCGTTRSQSGGVAPVQSSAYSSNCAPTFGFALRCTEVPATNCAEQVPGPLQLSPFGLLAIC